LILPYEIIGTALALLEGQRTKGEYPCCNADMAKCRVSFTNDEGSHSVEVAADTLFEAVALAVAEFREDKTISQPPDAETE
jgi:hypothetical protein